ncbi:MAG: hypothetical protein Q9227_003673 [Pyrenula ochraceoflavens]
MLRGRKPKDKAARNRAPSESQNRLSKKLSKSSDDGDKPRSHPPATPFEYLLQNETFCQEATQLPLPESIPTTPSSSLVLPDRPKSPELTPKDRAQYQATIEDVPDEPTPRPTPALSADDKKTTATKESSSFGNADKRRRSSIISNKPTMDKAKKSSAEERMVIADDPKVKDNTSRYPLDDPQMRKKRTREEKPTSLPPKSRDPVPTKNPAGALGQGLKHPPQSLGMSSQEPVQPAPMSQPSLYQYPQGMIEVQQPPSPQMPGGFPSTTAAPGSPKSLPAQPMSPTLQEARSADATQLNAPYTYNYPPHMPYSSVYAHPYWGAGFYHAEPMAERSGSVQGRSAHPESKEKDSNQRPQSPPTAPAISDIDRLLNKYRLAQSELSARERQSQETEKMLAREVEDLKRQLSAHRSEFTKVLNDTIIERNKERSECAKLRNEKDALVTEMDKASVRISILTADYSHVAMERDQLKNETENLRAYTASLQRSVQECDSLRLEIASLHQGKREDAENLAIRQRDLDSLNAVKTAMEQEIHNLKKEMTSQKALHETQFAAEQESSRTQIDSLRKEMVSLKDSHSRLLTDEQEKSRKQLDHLQSEILAHKTSHERAITEQQDKSKSDLAAKEENIKRINFDHRVELSRAVGEASDLRKKYNMQCHELDNAKLLDVDRRRSLEKLERELREAHEQHSNEIASLQSKIDEDKARRDQQGEEDIKRVHDEHVLKEHELQKELNMLRSRLTSSEKDVQQAVDEQKALEQDKEEERARRLRVTDSLRRMQDMIAGLNDERGSLDRTLQALGHTSDMPTKRDEFS